MKMPFLFAFSVLLLVGCSQEPEAPTGKSELEQRIVLVDAPPLDIIGAPAPAAVSAPPPIPGGPPVAAAATAASNQMTPEMQLAVERLNELVHVWYLRNKRYPANIEEMASEGMTTNLPALPPNHRFHLEPETHKVTVAFGQ